MRGGMGADSFGRKGPRSRDRHESRKQYSFNQNSCINKKIFERAPFRKSASLIRESSCKGERGT